MDVEDSLVTKEDCQSMVASQNDKPKTKITKKKIIIISVSIVIELALIVAVVLITLAKPDNVLQPVKIRIALPADRPTQIELGRSRVLEVLFYSGRDNRTIDDFMNVVNRDISWSTNPEGIITVDPYGRVQTLALGKTAVKVQSRSNPKAQYQSTIEVISPYKAMGKDVPKRIVNYKGVPAAPNKVLQKYITKYTKDEVEKADQIPVSIKDVSRDSIGAKKTTIVWQNNMMISWNITQYADGSKGKFYIKRVDKTAKDPRDAAMSMVSDRYLPGDGSNVISIEDDGQLGLWLVNIKGEVSHIEMKEVSYTSKAKAMVQQTQEKVLRHGLASGSYWDGAKWHAGIADNDGLWTSMYAAGEFMRYASLKQGHFPDEQIALAKASALQSLKAVLLISNIAGRDKIVDARIRHFVNSRAGQIAFLSSQFLKKGKTYSIDNYVGSSIDGNGFFGIDAGKVIDDTYYGGTRKYSYESFEPNDWSKDATKDEPATTKRTLNGFIARSFVIPALDGPPPGGLFYKHNANGTQTVLSQASLLYDYNDTDHPVLDLGNLPLPQVLQDFLHIDGVQYNKSDLVYKGDTSSDQTIGHLFLYKIAYDILDESIADQKILKQLIRSTMQTFCHCLSNNGYNMVDATGQGTKWGKLVRDFMIIDGTIQDAPIKSMILLMSYKLCYYVTGNDIWQNQYAFLVEDPSFRYLDLNAAVWRRWTWRAYNQDYSPKAKLLHLDSSKDYSEQQVTRHMMYMIHYSDEEQALLGYYLAFQLQENEQYLAKYREGLDGWWHSISRSENPLWYYIYQLAYPDKKIKDHFGNDILQTSSWQLSRHPVSARRSKAFVEGSRNDVMLQGDHPIITVDPSRPISRRKQQTDAVSANRTLNKAVFDNFDPLVFYEVKILPADERSVHKFNGATFQSPDQGNYNEMQPSTSFTLPYWMGVYHKMLEMD